MIRVPPFLLELTLVFKNVRLVCRLRKSSPNRAPASITASPPSGASSFASTQPDEQPMSRISPSPPTVTEVAESASEGNTPVVPTPSPGTQPKRRYFIMKSLTKEDVAWSVANKVWATQPHNEVILNDAFKVSSSKIWLTIEFGR